ncbi:hypothetical protein [Deinococcus sp. Leaf326]|uniref:hypothetical protein n=1 Tax=Deinococcus sp. Leaf326 TaxID=1736338 RepID=UPI0006F676AF|nr:hypothetical protein [Deinococcus sp. Leaf326]KQR25707.1 hypothetical protein ASF71_18655 [Deinococcus sp. Leaf326]
MPAPQTTPRLDAAGEQYLADMARLREEVRARQPTLRAVPQLRHYRRRPAPWLLVLGGLSVFFWARAGT